jgi:hypothetical protein
MIDRLVCADGGNPDPTTTGGKDPRLAKQLELKGWDYPRHLAGRVFSVVVHGDASGTENLRRMLSDWLCDIGMIPAGRKALLDAYVGYYQPYATSLMKACAPCGRNSLLQMEKASLAARIVTFCKAGSARNLPPIIRPPFNKRIVILGM